MEMTEVLYRRMPGRLQPLSTKVVKLRRGLQSSPLVQSLSGGPPPGRRSYYITGDKREKKKRLKYEWSAGNKFNTSYRDISVIVAENNSVVKPNYQQYTSLNKMLSNFSTVLMAHISFTAVINNGGIGKGIGGIRKGTKNYIHVL